MKRLGLYLIIVVMLVLSACSPKPETHTVASSTPPAIECGSCPKEVEDGFSALPTVRPDYGDGQVKDPEYLAPGQFLLAHTRGGDFKILIFSRSFSDSSGKCRFNYTYWVGDWPLGTFYYPGYCSDFGLVAYESGPWNTNYLSITGQRPLPPSKIIALKVLMTQEP
ncbi:MAG: hypothetical protein NTZ07_02070 [Candidatus Woesebacteria bacterium]|nr:hypothetical protein [Candidatus Woesebacteria bacterium]